MIPRSKQNLEDPRNMRLSIVAYVHRRFWDPFDGNQVGNRAEHLHAMPETTLPKLFTSIEDFIQRGYQNVDFDIRVNRDLLAQALTPVLHALPKAGTPEFTFEYCKSSQVSTLEEKLRNFSAATIQQPIEII